MSRALVVLTLSGLCYFGGYAVLLPTLPLYVKGPLHQGKIMVGVVSGAFALAALVCRPFVGRLSDRRGRKLTILLGAGLVAIAAAAIVPIGSVGLLIVLRLAGGCGEALFFVGAVSAVTDIAPDERRGEAVSWFSVSLYLGIALGPTLGESVLHHVGFDGVWLVSSALVA